MNLRTLQPTNNGIIHQQGTAFAAVSTEICSALSTLAIEPSPHERERFSEVFSLVPDAHFCYLTAQCKHGLQRIEWALQARSLIAICGAEGSGKSTMLLRLAQELEITGEYRTAIVRTPLRRTALAFTQAIVRAARLAPARSTYEHLHQIAAHAKGIYETGKRLVLLIDDADRLTKRMLGILHSLVVVTVGHDLAIGIIFAGSRRLEKRLRAYPALLSRIGASLTLNPLTIEETREMMEFRSRTTGKLAPTFTDVALHRLHRFTGGNPARIIKAQLTINR